MNDALNLLFEVLFSFSVTKTLAKDEAVLRYEH